jgi:maltose-binding protein MalE
MVKRNNRQSTRRDFTRILMFILLISLIGIAACSPADPTQPAGVNDAESTPTAAAAATAEPATAAAEETLTATATTAATASPVGNGKTLTVWVPPQFDPATNNEVSKLMTGIVTEFIEENPNTQVSIRVKALSGDSSAINTLSAAVNAAPEIIPSLIILNRNDMLEAVRKGLIYPISTGIFSDAASWYTYAKESSAANNLIYSIPIAGDPLVLGYRPSKTGAEVTTWEEILSRGLPIAFDPSSADDLLGTFIYLAMGGRITNDLSQPWLDQSILTQTLELFLSGGQKGAFPPSLAQGSTGTDNLQQFIEGSIHMIVTKMSAIQRSQKTDISMIPLPLFNEHKEYPMVETWNIVLSNTNPDIQTLAVKLAEKMADPNFNDRWSYAAGYLPVRTNAHNAWENDPFYVHLETLAENGQLIQPGQTLNKVIPEINEAISAVIKTIALPQDAAAAAVEALN